MTRFILQDLQDCDKSVVKGFSSPEAVTPLCHVSSKSDGTFIFPTLPTGKYFIVIHDFVSFSSSGNILFCIMLQGIEIYAIPKIQFFTIEY